MDFNVSYEGWGSVNMHVHGADRHDPVHMHPQLECAGCRLVRLAKADQDNKSSKRRRRLLQAGGDLAELRDTRVVLQLLFRTQPAVGWSKKGLDQLMCCLFAKADLKTP